MTHSRLSCFGLLGCGWLMMAVCVSPLTAAPVDAITFHAEPGQLFVPVDEAVKELRWTVERDEKCRVVRINDVVIPAGTLRSLTDGTELLSTADLQQLGADVSPPDATGEMKIGRGWRGFTLAAGAQRVEVNLATQQLKGWQGGRLVLQTRISSGRHGSTPAGDFHAGPYRARMHRSSRYHNAPMPWSVQINGHVFIHGFTSVPRYPASHGCIRLPLNEGNPAKFFYEWVDNGTPVRVTRD